MPLASLADDLRWYYGFVISKEQILQAAETILDKSDEDNKSAFDGPHGPNVDHLITILNIAFYGTHGLQTSVCVRPGTILDILIKETIRPRGIVEVFSDVRMHEGKLHRQTDWAFAIFTDTYAHYSCTKYNTELTLARAHQIAQYVGPTFGASNTLKLEYFYDANTSPTLKDLMGK